MAAAGDEYSWPGVRRPPTAVPPAPPQAPPDPQLRRHGLDPAESHSQVSLFLTSEASGQTALGPREAGPRSPFGPHDCRRGSERWQEHTRLPVSGHFFHMATGDPQARLIRKGAVGTGCCLSSKCGRGWSQPDKQGPQPGR